MILLGFAAPVGLMALLHFAAKREMARRCGDNVLVLSTTRVNRTFTKPFLRALVRIEAKYPTPPDRAPLIVGDECRLVHGLGPVMLVVDGNGEAVIVSWDEGCQEYQFARCLVRRHRPREMVEKNVKASA